MNAGRPWSRLAALVCVLSLLPLAAAAAAQPAGSEKAPAVELPEPLTRDAIRELVARLSDEEVRELLLAQLDKAAAPPADAGGRAHGRRPRGERRPRPDRARRHAPGRARATRPRWARRSARFSEGRPPVPPAARGRPASSSCWRSAGSPSGWSRRLLAGVRGRLERSADDAPGVEAGSLVIRLVLDLLLAGGLRRHGDSRAFLALYQGHEADPRADRERARWPPSRCGWPSWSARFLLAPHSARAAAPAVRRRVGGALYRGVVALAWLYGVLDVLTFFLRRFGVPREPYPPRDDPRRGSSSSAARSCVWSGASARPIAATIRGDGQGTLRRHAGRPLAGPDDRLRPVPPGGPDGRAAGRPPRARAAAGILSLLVVIAMPLVDMALCRPARPAGGAGPSRTEPGRAPARASGPSCDRPSTSWSPSPAPW